MQTFLPYPDFAESARVLDVRRLGRQRVETMQILRALKGISRGWRNHPATRMWRGHERSLGEYGLAVCREWRSRGFQDTVLEKIQAEMEGLPDTGPPPWLGDPAVHQSHRSRLLQKQPDWYRQFWPDERDDLGYVWPG